MEVIVDPAPVVVMAGSKSDMRSRVMGDMVVVVGGVVVDDNLGKPENVKALFLLIFGVAIGDKERKYSRCCQDRVSCVSLVPRNCKIGN